MYNLLLIYFILGFIWLAFMEYYTTRHKIGPSWTDKERITQLIIWPLAFVIFLKELYKNL